MRNNSSEIDLGEKIIIWMIAVEILLSLVTIGATVHEARLQDEALEKILTAQKQVDTDLGIVNSKLGDLNGGIAQTVSKLGDLNTGIARTVNAARQSAETSKKIDVALQSQLHVLTQEQSTLQQQAQVLNQQLAVQKQQWEKENQRPVLEVRAVTFNPGIPGNSRGAYSTLLLSPNPRPDLGQATDINMTVHVVSEKYISYSPLDLNVRNVGTGDALNFILTPAPSQDVTVRCVDYPALALYTQRTSGLVSDECVVPVPSSVLPPIVSRPKDRPAHMEDPGWGGTEFDPAFDAKVRVNLTVPLDVNVFDLEFVVTADKLSPTRYMVHCHMPRR